MSTKTVEIGVGRGREMGPGGTAVPSPLAPFDIPEPELGGDRMLINIGPQHPATHGVLRLVIDHRRTLVAEILQRAALVVPLFRAPSA